jgi:hypothetical protein
MSLIWDPAFDPGRRILSEHNRSFVHHLANMYARLHPHRSENEEKRIALECFLVSRTEAWKKAFWERMNSPQQETQEEAHPQVIESAPDNRFKSNATDNSASSPFDAGTRRQPRGLDDRLQASSSQFYGATPPSQLSIDQQATHLSSEVRKAPFSSQTASYPYAQVFIYGSDANVADMQTLFVDFLGSVSGLVFVSLTMRYVVLPFNSELGGPLHSLSTKIERMLHEQTADVQERRKQRITLRLALQDALDDLAKVGANLAKRIKESMLELPIDCEQVCAFSQKLYDALVDHPVEMVAIMEDVVFRRVNVPESNINRRVVRPSVLNLQAHYTACSQPCFPSWSL